MNKKKASYGKSEGFSYAVKIDSLDSNDFYKMPFDRQIDDLRRIAKWKEGATLSDIYCKGKSTFPQVKKWIKENKPNEFYYKNKIDSQWYKDDCVIIYYK